jgi:hypothetical protein
MSIRHWWKAKNGSITRWRLVSLTIMDPYSLVPKCKRFLDTLGTSLVPPVGFVFEYTTTNSADNKRSIRHWWKAKNGPMTRWRLVSLTIMDGYSMVQKCRPFLDTLGTSLGPPVGFVFEYTTTSNSADNKTSRREWWKAKNGSMTMWQLVALTMIDGYSMVQKCRPFLDTLGTSLGPPAVGFVFEYTTTTNSADNKMSISTGGRPRMDLWPGDGWSPWPS